MRIVSTFFILSILIFGCRPLKNAQSTQGAVAKTDTGLTVVDVKDKPATKETEVAPGKDDVFAKVLKNNISFNSFNAKVRVQYESKEGGDDATAYVRLKKDSIMWLSLRGPLGIEGFRVLITPDSVKVIDFLKKNVQYKSIDYLAEITGIPFDFSNLQDIVVGNPVFTDSNISSARVNENNQLVVLMEGKFFHHLISLDKTDFKVLHSRLDDVDSVRNLSCDITFSDYENAEGVMFSAKRKISVKEKSELIINLDFKQYSFNQAVTFPFNVPKNYKRL